MIDAKPTPPPARVRLASAERRVSFLDAATEIIAESGPSAVTMDGVAARTGVNKRLIYRFFDNRDKILREVMARELDEVGRRARALLPGSPSLEQRVAVNIRVWLEIMQERGPVLARLMFDQDVAAAIAREVTLHARLDWGQVYCEALDVSPSTAEILAAILLAGLRGAVDMLQSGRAPLEEIAEIYSTLTVTAAYEIARRHPRPPSAPDAQ